MMKWWFSKENYPKILLGLFWVFWVFVAISPKYRLVWFSENIVLLLFVFLLMFTYKKFKFSNFSYILIFILLILHVVGSYYSYAEMPLFDLIKEYFNLSRNHYDRFVHFLFGLFFFFPVYEFVSRKFKIRGFWGLFLSFLVVIGLKCIYGVFEWLWVLVSNQGIVVSNFLGEQGDSWDVYKDLALGILGSLISWVGEFKFKFISKK